MGSEGGLETTRGPTPMVGEAGRVDQVAQVMELAGIGLCRVSADERLISINRAALRLLGLEQRWQDPATAEGRRLDELGLADWPPAALKAQLESGAEVKDFSCELSNSEGAETHLLIDAVRGDADGAAGGTTLLLRRDAERSSEAAVEEKLVEKERFLQNVFSSIQDGISVLDTDLIVMQVNATMERWYRHAMPLVGRKCHAVYHGNDQPCEICPTRQAMATRATAVQTVPKRGPTGIEGWLELYAFPLIDRHTDELYGVIEYVRDITERRRAEGALAESEGRSRAILDAVPDLIFQLSGDGIITDFSGEASLLYKPADEFIGKAVTEVLPPELAEITLRSQALALETGEMQFYEYELDIQGETHHFEARQVKSGDSASLTIVRDISERKRAEAQIQGLTEELEGRVHERTAQLEFANRELEAFAYSVSHDLRTPLHHIDGFSQVLEEDYAKTLDQDGTRYLERIRNAVKRMTQLIDDLLKMSRVARSPLTPELVPLSAVAESVLNELSLVEHQRKVDIIIEPGIIAHGDTELLRVVMENLLSNAWKFSQTRDPAVIEFGSLESDGVPGKVGADQSVYFVKDNGVGFAPKYASQLFGAFQRLHGSDEFPGTGVGLATVKRIIERHGGQVWAEGEIDGGATFYFTL